MPFCGCVCSSDVTFRESDDRRPFRTPPIRGGEENQRLHRFKLRTGLLQAVQDGLLSKDLRKSDNPTRVVSVQYLWTVFKTDFVCRVWIPDSQIVSYSWQSRSKPRSEIWDKEHSSSNSRKRSSKFDVAASSSETISLRRCVSNRPVSKKTWASLRLLAVNPSVLFPFTNSKNPDSRKNSISSKRCSRKVLA